MEHLHDGGGPFILDGFDHRFPGIDLPLGEQPGLSRISLGTFIVGYDGLGVDDGRSVFRPSDQKIQDILTGNTVFDG